MTYTEEKKKNEPKKTENKPLIPTKTTKVENLQNTKTALEQEKNIPQNMSQSKDISVKKKNKIPNFIFIRKGDTLYSISKKFYISLQTLKRINNLQDNTLKIGQKLKLKE